MRRLLATTMALGLVITAMNFTGIFAVFTDRATTGANNAQSNSQPRMANLEIATTVAGDCSDGEFHDDLETGIISAGGLLIPGAGSGFTPMCLRNVGTSDLDITVTAIDVVETETGCTGDEEAAGDTTCGTAGIGDGDLAAVLLVTINRLECGTATIESTLNATFASVSAGPEPIGALGAGEIACLWVQVSMLYPGEQGPTIEATQRAQTDNVEWRFAFDGTQA